MKSFKEILKEQPMQPQQQQSDPIVVVPGIGTMSLSRVKQEVQLKLQDLMQRAQSEQYNTISKTQIDVLAAYWEAARSAGV